MKNLITLLLMFVFGALSAQNIEFKKDEKGDIYAIITDVKKVTDKEVADMVVELKKAIAQKEADLRALNEAYRNALKYREDYETLTRSKVEPKKD